MSGRYIDADALKQKIFAHWYTCEEIDETIDAMPTADVVEVVRCRDCKHLKMKIGWGECDIYRWSIPYEDHYCGYGERRRR